MDVCFRCVCLKDGYCEYLMAFLIKPQLVDLTSVKYVVPKYQLFRLISQLAMDELVSFHIWRHLVGETEEQMLNVKCLPP